jgi:hypothetical protein
MNHRLTLFVLALAALVLAGICSSPSTVTVADGGPILVCPPKDKKCWTENPLPHVAQEPAEK